MRRLVFEENWVGVDGRLLGVDWGPGFTSTVYLAKKKRRG
jgi:hypothetical protein